MKFSKSGELEHYFTIKEEINLIKKTSRTIFGKIAEFLYELFLKSFDIAVQKEEDLDSDDEFSYEEYKVIKDQTPFPDDVYEEKLDLFTFSYLLTQKVDSLQFLIQNLYWNVK